jgi:hypothetical protein
VSLRGDTSRDLTLSQLALRLKREYFRAIRGMITDARERASLPADFMGDALSAIAQAVGAAAGAHYAIEDGLLIRTANFGCEPSGESVTQRVGEGLHGRVALTGEAMVFDELEKQGTRVRTGLLELIPTALLLYPIERDSRVVGVIELLFLNASAPTARELLDYLMEDLSRGPRAFEPTAETARVKQLEEELVIANTRLERLNSELQSRERSPRAAAGA